MDYSVLVKSPLFSLFSENETESLLSGIRYRIRKYKRGSIIAVAGEPVDALMLLLSGTARGEIAGFNGRITMIEEVFSPGTLAAAFIFARQSNMPVNLTAVTDVELLVIDRCELLKLMLINEKFLINFMEVISNRAHFLSERLRFFNFKTIKGKLAGYFLEKAGNGNHEFHLDVTQNELAVYFGVTRPSLSRALCEMRKEKIIDFNRKRIKITDRDRLSELTGE